MPSPDTRTIPQLARQTLAQTGEWIGCFGPRLAGSVACRRAAEAIAARLAAICGQARIEYFATHPDTFYRFYQIDALLYLAGVILILAGQPLLAGLVLLFMVSAAGAEFGWYVEFYDRLFPRRTCQNVTAVLEPRGEARCQLIFSGHHDSAPELKFLRRHQKLYGLKIVIPDFVRMFALVTAWGWVIVRALTGETPDFVLPARLLLVLGVWPVFTKFFIAGPQVSPGAGDNLVACAMLASLAGRFADPRAPGHSVLEHTRLIFASFDAEEAGLRGSRAWVKAHRAELDRLPTLALNIDSIYQARHLACLLSDLNSHIPLDRPLAERCQQIAASRGVSIGTAVMRFGGGGTDAAELARAGVRATTLIAMPAGLVRDGLVYHTVNDTVEAIEPDAVEACLAIAEGLAMDVEREGNTGDRPGIPLPAK